MTGKPINSSVYGSNAPHDQTLGDRHQAGTATRFPLFDAVAVLEVGGGMRKRRQQRRKIRRKKAARK